MWNEAIAAPADDALANFSAASGISGEMMSRWFGELISALLLVGVCWIMVASIYAWIRQDAKEKEVFWNMARSAVLVVAVSAMLLLF